MLYVTYPHSNALNVGMWPMPKTLLRHWNDLRLAV